MLERGVALNDALQLARLAAPTTTPHAAAELLRRCLQEQSGVAIDTIAAAARGASSGDSGGIVGTAGFAWHTTKGGLGHVTPRQLSTAIVTQSQSQLQQYVAWNRMLGWFACVGSSSLLCRLLVLLSGCLLLPLTLASYEHWCDNCGLPFVRVWKRSCKTWEWLGQRQGEGCSDACAVGK